MMSVAPDIVERVRIDYLDSARSVRDVAARHGLSLSDIARLRVEHGWPARASRGRSKVLPASPSREKPAAKGRRSSSTTRVERRRVVRRLYAAIITKLGHLEDRMSSPEIPNPADAERETRALASLIRSVERVQELETDLTRDRARAGVATDPVSAGPNADAERKRRELAERIRRLGEQIARGNPGGTGTPPAG